jgi:predicted acyl esterase
MAENSPSLQQGRVLTGVFCDSPVQGLEYRTQTLSGITGPNGEFEYRSGETVTFSVGGLVIGAAPGESRVTPAHLAVEVGGDAGKIWNQKVTNIARLLQSIDDGGNIEERIVISGAASQTAGKYRYKILFDKPEPAFGEDADVKALFAELKKELRTGPQARNHLRRALMGIKKITDVKIPTRDGSYLMADVSRPVEDGKYPVVMSLGAYGRAFTFGCICNREDLLRHEEIEDRYFQGILPEPSTFTPGHPVVSHVAENFELVNTAEWVPQGYVVIRVEERGVGRTPGMFEQFSLQEAKDYYDAIEWAGTQEWSNGNVGLWGASYFAMNQYNVAQLQPPHLKAMVPISGDNDSYRDYIYSGGGLFNPFNFVAKNACGEWQGVDWVAVAKENPFDDPAIYGTEGKICISADLSKIKVPFWSAMGTEGTIHTRGSSEAFIHAASKDKKLLIISEAGIHFWSYARDYFEDYLAFFDHWLKGAENDIMERPPVKMMVRTGWGGYYWQYENEWPIARTKYTRYYLDAAPAKWEGDGRRQDFLSLSPGLPSQELAASYSAEAKWREDPPWSYGISFVSEPMTGDVLLAGYGKLGIWVSSSSYDMQVHATVRVVDENNMDVPYAVGNPTQQRLFPVAQGALKVSHRKQDPQKATAYRPWHTHRREDAQPLTPGEIVEAEVELWPTTALVRKGWRLRLNVQPLTGEGFPAPAFDPVDDKYQIGAANTVYTGPQHPSYVQLPVIPLK